MPETSWSVISLDASPWGFGGVCHINGTVANAVSHHPRWRPPGLQHGRPWPYSLLYVFDYSKTHEGICIVARSGSLSELPAAGKATSGSKAVVLIILCEFALAKPIWSVGRASSHTSLDVEHVARRVVQITRSTTSSFPD